MPIALDTVTDLMWWSRQICGITDSVCVVYPVTLGFGRHTAQVLAEPGGPQRAVLAAKIQMIVYRTSRRFERPQYCPYDYMLTPCYTCSLQYSSVFRKTTYLHAYHTSKAPGNVFTLHIVSFTLPNVAIAIFVHRCLDHRPWRVRLLWSMSIIQVVLALIPCIVIYCRGYPHI